MQRHSGHAGSLAFLLASCVFITPAASQPGSAAPQVEWRVKDRFRLFDRATSDARHRVQWLSDRILALGPAAPFVGFYDDYLAVISGRDASRAHSASLRMSNYQPTGDGPDRTSGRYSADYLYPERYFVEVRVANAANPAGVCTYSSGLETRRGRCGDWTAIAVGEGVAASRAGWRIDTAIQAEIPGRGRRRVPIQFADELVVALGDSYISGEGNPDSPSLINDRPHGIFERPNWGGRAQLNRQILRRAEWWDEPCHRSLLSWPVIASFVHSARNPHKAVTFVHLGCSGAIARDIFQQGETELPGGGDERESQLAMLDRLMQRPGDGWGRRRVDTTFLSVGGNDIGFVGVVSTITLPPNGFTLGPFIVGLVGQGADAVCPYRDSGLPLRRLCDTQASAEERLESLQTEYDRLQAAFETAGIDRTRVFQSTYPNPLINARGGACDTNPNNDEGSTQTGPRPASGFEALMGHLPRRARGIRFRSWNFELRYDPERDVTGSFNQHRGRLEPDLPIDCDWRPESSDSEVCQALWVHARLNDEVRQSPWPKFDAHYWRIAGHGMCSSSSDFPLALPTVSRHRWIGGRTPQAYDPYFRDAPRWFRVPNDSILTQFGFHAGAPRFHHGTAHPTFRAHIEFAEAAHNSAFRHSRARPRR